MGEFLSRSFLGNTALDWTMAIILAAVVWGAVRLAVRILLNRIKAFAAKTATDIDDLVAELLEKTKGLFVALVAFFAAGRFLDLPPDVDALMMRLVILGFLFQAAVWANGVVNYGLQSWAQRKFESDPTVVTALGSVGFLLRLGVWAYGRPSPCWRWTTSESTWVPWWRRWGLAAWPWDWHCRVPSPISSRRSPSSSTSPLPWVTTYR